MEELNVDSGSTENKKKENSKKKLLIAIISIIVFLIFLFAGIFAVKYFSDSAPEKETDGEKIDFTAEEQKNSEKQTAGMFHCGLVSVIEDDKWGYINENGELVIEYQFDYAGVFNKNGIAAVAVDDNYGLIDNSGKFIVNPRFEYVSSNFSDGYAVVRKDGKYGYVDKNGELVIDCYYDSAKDFRNGYAIVLFGSVYGVIDKDGNYVINPQYEDLSYAYSLSSGKNIFIAEKDSQYGYIDINGKTVIDFRFDSIVPDNGTTEFINDKYAVVSVNNKKGVIDTDGKYLIDAIYDELMYCGKNVFVFTDFNSDKKGFVTAGGEETVATQFDEVSTARSGLICVKLGDYYGFVDFSGKYIINPIFDEANSFNNGYAVVKKGDKYSFINTKGENVVSYQFDYMSDFNSEGYAIVAVDDKYGVINDKGEYVLKCSYYYLSGQSLSAESYEPLYDDYFYAVGEEKTIKIITPDGKEIAEESQGIGGNTFVVCSADGCYSLIADNKEAEYCYEHTVIETVSTQHHIDSYYSTNYTAYLRNPSARVTVYSACGVVAYGHWISGNDPVTIHEVYTDGCCKVSYSTDNGAVRTYYAKISDFATGHTVSSYYGRNYTAYLRNPSSKVTVYTACGVPAHGHWISGSDPVTIHEVYTDGCCKVSYSTDSGAVRTYYAKISDFTTGHTVSSYYGRNYIAYLRNPSSRVTVYSACGVAAYGHWIAGNDPVTIHEVYTDGCCKVSYATDSGSVKTYYAKIGDFVF